LNAFMEKKRFINEEAANNNAEHFRKMAKVLYDATQNLNHKGKISITLQDSLCYAIGKNIDSLVELTPLQVAGKIELVIGDTTFSEASLSEGLAKKQRLIDRMKKAEQLLR